MELGKHGEYLCSTNVLKAHATAYHIYNREFRPSQNGQIGIVLNTRCYYPKHKDAKDQGELVEVAYQYTFGRYAGPIFSKTGDYPESMKKMIAINSKYEGLSKSRLPVLTSEWIDYIKFVLPFISCLL